MEVFSVDFTREEVYVVSLGKDVNQNGQLVAI